MPPDECWGLQRPKRDKDEYEDNSPCVNKKITEVKKKRKSEELFLDLIL